jgi:multidrug efflux pump subunit AcrB
MMRNRHLLWLTVAVITIAGLTAYLTMPRQEDPRMTTRNATIITQLPGASADRVEALISEPIEDELREIEEIKDLESTSRAGVSIISVALLDETTAQTATPIFSEIRSSLEDVAPRLPPEASDPLFDDTRGAVAFTMILGVRMPQQDASSNRGPPRVGLLNRVAADLADTLRNVPGTELVRRYGEPAEQVTVRFEPDTLAELGLTAGELARRIASADTKVPSGRLLGENQTLQVEVAGELETLQTVRDVVLIDGPAGSVVRVGHVAEVERGWEQPAGEIALTDRRRTVLVAARVVPGTQVDGWATNARQAVEQFRARTGGVEIATVFDQSTYTTQRLGSLGFNLLLGATVVVLVIFFTMGLRSAVLVGSTLPLVSGLCLFGIQFFGNSLNQMSIFGMIIALGLLIDNAIVVVDEVGHQLRKDADRAFDDGFARRVSAVRETMRLLAGPLGASTLTTMLAFAPIVLLPGNAGDFVGGIGLSVILAVGGSYLVAITVIAAFAGLYLKLPAGAGGESADASGPARWWQTGLTSRRLSAGSRSVLLRLMRVPLLAMAIAALPPALGFAVYPTLGSAFFPPVDRDMFDLQLWMPTNTPVAQTRRTVEALHEHLMQTDGVESADWLIGSAFPSVFYNLTMGNDNSPFYARAAVKSASVQATERLVPQLQREIDERFPEARVLVRAFNQGPPVTADIEYRIYGPDQATLQELGEQLRARLQSHPDVLQTDMSMPRGEAKFFFDADPQAVAVAGLTRRGVAEQLQATLDGARGGQVVEDLEQMPVEVRVGDSVRSQAEAIAGLRLIGADGDAVPLAAVGSFDLRPAIGGITRFNGRRTNTVSAYTRPDALAIDIAYQTLAELRADESFLPPGYSIELGGEAENEGEATGNLFSTLPVLMVFMAAALILTFRSVVLALVLGGVAILAVGLAFLSTWTISFPVSFNTILGTLGLIGVAINDTIVVLAAIRADPRAAAGDRTAVVDATLGCGRHVISTTLTTIGGFLPLLLLTEGDFWPSLAVVLAGGIGGATLIAMLFIPAVYILLHRRHRATPAAA